MESLETFKKVLISKHALILFDAKVDQSLSSLHILLASALRQIIVNQNAFDALIGNKVASVAVAVLRMQLEIGARINALSLVEDPVSLAESILKSESLNRFRDRENNRLYDAYLLNRLLQLKPSWAEILEKLYRAGCAHIHFSAAAVSRGFIKKVDSISVRSMEDDFLDEKEFQDTKFAMDIATFLSGEVTLNRIERYLSRSRSQEQH